MRMIFLPDDDDIDCDHTIIISNIIAIKNIKLYTIYDEISKDYAGLSSRRWHCLNMVTRSVLINHEYFNETILNLGTGGVL